MGKLAKFFGFEADKDAEFSSNSYYPQYPVPDGFPLPASDPRIAYLFSPDGISRNAAMSIPAVSRGMHALTSIANLPLVTYNGQNEKAVNKLLEQVDEDVTNIVTISATIEDLVFDGVAYWHVTQTSSKGYPVKARHLPLRQVIEQVTENPLTGEISYEFWLMGHKVDNSQIIRFESPRPGLLKLIAQSVRQAMALAKASETYANHPAPKIIVSDAPGLVVPLDKAKAALQSFSDGRADSPYAYLGNSLVWKQVDLLSPAELQLIEQDKAVQLAIANFFDMDPEEIGLSTTTRTYKNAVDRRIDRRNDQLGWVAQTVEQRLSLGDITPRGYFVRFDFGEFFRADPLTRAQVAQIEWEMGAITMDEYRTETGRAPLTPEQMSKLKPRETFSEDAETNLDFEGACFQRESVNTTSRTVVGLAVPYGQSARSGGRKWQFEKGSLHWTDLSRVKLLRDHDNTQAVGYAIHADDTDSGLVITFKVAPGPKGDAALADFLAGTHDGLSIGVNFEESDYEPSEEDPTIRKVKRAQLREVSQTAMPAFDDSRSITVTAQRDVEEINMSENTTETVDVNKMVTEAVTAAFAAQNKNLSIQESAPEPARLPEPPKTVAATFVNEAPLYRFDGSKGNYEFSSDLIEMSKGDSSARERVNKFMSAEFAVTTSNAATLNPTIQRPDMYVGQMDIRTPIMDRILKGSVPNGVSPFAFPKYNSSATLVADHVEGTEPTLGSYSVTNQTVTPTALSGKIEINREAWDQGGSPLLSQIIRTDMHRAYREGLETSAATFLDGLTLTGKEVTITTAAADSALEGLVIDALITLQGERGGQYLTEFVQHVDLYKALVKAKDGNGRRLFPAVAPQNATGSVSKGFVALDINGLEAVYAPALGATGTVAENSYLFDPAKLHAWATPPQDLTFDIQVKSIYLGIWGYKAFALQDVNGIRRFIYDPA